MAALTARNMRLPMVARPCGLARIPLTGARPFSQLLSSGRLRSMQASTPSTSTALSTRSLFTKRKPRPFYKAFVWTLLAFGATFGVAYHLDSRSAVHRWIAIPVLQAATDPETAQKLAIKLLATGVMPRDMVADDEILSAEVAGLRLSNPIGLAAGFDKQAEAIDGLLNLGFGIVEIGSVTPEPQPGNEKPRYFRLVADRAAINRYGFNSEGHSVILGRLRERVQQWILNSSNLARSRIAVPDSESEAAHLLREADLNAVLASDHVPKSLRSGQLLAINLGKNKNSPEDSVKDYVKGVEKLGQYADLIVVNISSPNTPGLRNLQKKEVLGGLMSQVVEARDRLSSSKVPIFVKISPDLDTAELNDIADAALKSGIQGLIVSNTTTSRPSSLKSKTELTEERGGLSGAPLKPLSLKAVQAIRKRVGDKISIIGCGGIFSGEDALDFAKAGADAVELYTSFGYEGVGHPRRVKDELIRLLKTQGKTWKECVGSGLGESDYLSKLPDGEKDFGKVGSLHDQFGVAVAEVKGELEDLRRSAGLAHNAVVSSTEKEEEMRNDLLHSSSQTARPVFRPDASDKEYVTLLDKINEALGTDPGPAEKFDTMETSMTKTQALRAKLGIALQDPSIPPSAAIEEIGESAIVGRGEAAYSGKIESPLKALRKIDGRGTAIQSGRASEGRLGMGGKADFNAADRARVV
ncbi:hypothetical protein CBS101457_001994 [Exobasidium rhododendri]|nr:hypothetical protein CBS101457_001994 [Exobasidium rhododendri]